MIESSSGRAPERGTRTGHRDFTLVLAGGGARGFAHAGVLRVLEGWGLRPSGIVGVSMGAVVGVTYALRPRDWYLAILAMETDAFPGPLRHGRTPSRWLEKVRRAVAYLRAAEEMVLDWGPGSRARDAGLESLRGLLGNHELADARVPVAVCATDLRRGDRVILRSGSAVEAVYASAALAGVLPPVPSGEHLLADGAYADVAPIDVARSMGAPVVLVVDPGQLAPGPDPRNGLQAVMRAVDICHRKHAALRFERADIVIHPEFRRVVETLDFGARRECIAAGMRAVRALRSRIDELLADRLPPSS